MGNKVSMFFACRTLLYALLFLTPFLFVQNTNELFEFPKMYFVYFAGSLLVGVTALKRLWGAGRYDQSLLFRDALHKPFFLLAGLFATSFILSTMLSTHSYTSIWGYFSRFNGGLVSVLIFFGIFLATSYLKLSTREILKVISLTIVPISFYAIMQHFGLGGSWATDTTVRAFATFGQPNWYGAYCAMVLPIVLYFALESNSGPVSKKVGWWLLFALGFTGFWFSYSVSGIIGLTISTLLVVLLSIKSIKNNLGFLFTTASICLLVAFLTPGIFNQKLNDALTDIFPGTSKVNNNPQSQLPTATSDITPTTSSSKDNQEQPTVHQPSDQQIKESPTYNLTDSGFIRKGIWQGAIDLWLSSPKNTLLGTGPQTFPYEFQKFRPASLNYSSEWNFILNKPHNYYLELLAQNGLVGLLLYLAIIIKVLLAKHPILTPALVGLFVTNIFGWPTVATTLLFWVFLALLETNKSSDAKHGEQQKNLQDYVEESLINPLAISNRTNRVPLSIFYTAILFLSYGYLNIRFVSQYMADLSSKASDRKFEKGEIQEAMGLINKSVSLNPYEPFYYRQRAKTYVLTTVGQQIDQLSYTKALALKNMLKARELNPQNLATLRGEISLYYFLALDDLTATAKEIPQTNQFDPFYLELARNYYTKLAQNYPTDVGVQTQVAKYQKLLNFTNDYPRTVAQIKNLRPDLLKWYLD